LIVSADVDRMAQLTGGPGPVDLGARPLSRPGIRGPS